MDTKRHCKPISVYFKDSGLRCTIIKPHTIRATTIKIRFSWRQPGDRTQTWLPTSIQDVLEDKLWRLIVEGRDACEELKQAHPQRPPVHHHICPETTQLLTQVHQCTHICKYRYTRLMVCLDTHRDAHTICSAERLHRKLYSRYNLFSLLQSASGSFVICIFFIHFKICFLLESLLVSAWVSPRVL